MKKSKLIIASMEIREALQRHQAQIESFCPGLRISFKDLLSFLVNSHGEQLSQKELKEIKEAHFDPEKQARWVLKQIQQAKARGENATVAELFKKGNKSRDNSREKKGVSDG